MTPLRSILPRCGESGAEPDKILYALPLSRHILLWVADVNVRFRRAGSSCERFDPARRGRAGPDVNGAGILIEDSSSILPCDSVAEGHGAGHALGSFQFRCG
jgi:hypothetical protein